MKTDWEKKYKEVLKIIRRWTKNINPDRSSTAQAILSDIRELK